MRITTSHGPHRSLGVGALAMALVVTMAGCVFELDVCQSNEQCGSTQQCSDGLCVEKPRERVVANNGTDTTWTADKGWVLTDVITVNLTKVRWW